MNTKRERGQATRNQLIAIATRLFTERGYDGTSIEAVLRESGVSRGALYHHFAGKDDLFAAVFGAVQQRVGDHLTAATRDCTTAAEALRVGCAAWIRLTADPDVHRILLIDAPTVLGWQRWREADEQRVLGRIKRGLAALADAGVLPPEHCDVAAHALLAAMNEIAMMVARADDPATAATAAEAAVNDLLHRLLAHAPV